MLARRLRTREPDCLILMGEDLSRLISELRLGALGVSGPNAAQDQSPPPTSPVPSGAHAHTLNTLMKY